MITILRSGIHYPIAGQHYHLTRDRLVVDDVEVPLPWFAPARRAPSIVGAVLAFFLRAVS
jgi:hypothetical protein